jgi:hypothetical protein
MRKAFDRASVTCLVMAVILLAGTASTARAATIMFTTDASWLAKNALPGTGWNTTSSFDTTTDTGWINATVSVADCSGLQDCIWYDGQFSGTQEAYFRQTFTVNDPVTFASLMGAFDDDGQIWINGTQVHSDLNGLATNYGPIDIAPYLVQGTNLIAAWGRDNFNISQNHAFRAEVTVETAAVPEPTSLLLLTMGLAGLAARRSRRR